MNKHSLAYLSAPPHRLDHLTTPPLEAQARDILLKHGCTLQEGSNKCMIFFPEGTTRVEIFLRTMSPRYQITLPDGYELREVYD